MDSSDGHQIQNYDALNDCLGDVDKPILIEIVRSEDEPEKEFITMIYRIAEGVSELNDTVKVRYKEVRKFKPGDIVQHFKRETLNSDEKRQNKFLYEIIGEAIDSETREKVMVYRALYNDKDMFVRPYDMFISEVDHNKYPDIRQKFRFEIIENLTE